jgi:hypothetical protein
MGFFNSNTQVVDAILTRYGRDKLAGGQSLGITRFALSDDGVDYDLWNTQHPSGSTSFGEAIESMPVLEAFPDEDVCLSYKLESGARTTSRRTVIYFKEKTLNVFPGQTTEIKPLMANNQGNQRFVFKIPDTRYATFVKTPTTKSPKVKRQYPDSQYSAIWAGQPTPIKSVEVKGVHKQDTRTVKVQVFDEKMYQFATIKLNIVGTEDNSYMSELSRGER